MAIRIMTDAAADLTREEREALSVSVIPLQVIFGEETFLAGETLDRDVFWNRLIAGENPTTSQPSPEMFLHAFESA
ncbi:MAG: DegV family protein, partial [Clostridia bacterium]|nr:DegV family protein [Clostridia bacterium]